MLMRLSERITVAVRSPDFPPINPSSRHLRRGFHFPIQLGIRLIARGQCVLERTASIADRGGLRGGRSDDTQYQRRKAHVDAVGGTSKPSTTKVISLERGEGLK